MHTLTQTHLSLTPTAATFVRSKGSTVSQNPPWPTNTSPEGRDIRKNGKSYIYIESTVSNLLICANCKNIGSHDRLGLGLPWTSTPRGRDARFMQHWNTTAHEPGWRIRPMYPECTGYVTMSRRPKMRANPWSHFVETCWNYQWCGTALEKWCKLCFFQVVTFCRSTYHT